MASLAHKHNPHRYVRICRLTTYCATHLRNSRSHATLGADRIQSGLGDLWAFPIDQFCSRRRLVAFRDKGEEAIREPCEALSALVAEVRRPKTAVAPGLPAQCARMPGACTERRPTT